MKVELTIKDNKTGKYIIVPVLPESIEYTCGDALAASVTIINLGTIEIPNGVDLDSMTWSSFFPARYDASYCNVKTIKKPLDYRKLIEDWKNAGTSLQLICPQAGINKTMYVKSFVPALTGFEGDISYSITLRELVTIKPVKVKIDAKTLKRATKTAASRTKVAAPIAKTTKYTVKSGDTLVTIAKKLKVASWETIYDKNKKVIGSRPNNLKAGMVLTV